MQEIVYIADPMCSWCWAMAPNIEQLLNETGLAVRVTMGGLHIGSDAPEVTERMAAGLASHWDQLGETSGQPFDSSELTPGWRYETHTASTAVVALRELKPDLALEYLSRVQRAFFAEKADITNKHQLALLVEPFGIDPAGFEILMGTPDIEESTLNDYAWAHGLGATSFPTVLFATDTWARAVAIGYTKVPDMLRNVEGALRRVDQEESS